MPFGFNLKSDFGFVVFDFSKTPLSTDCVCWLIGFCEFSKVWFSCVCVSYSLLWLLTGSLKLLTGLGGKSTRGGTSKITTPLR